MFIIFLGLLWVLNLIFFIEKKNILQIWVFIWNFYFAFLKKESFFNVRLVSLFFISEVISSLVNVTINSLFKLKIWNINKQAIRTVTPKSGLGGPGQRLIIPASANVGGQTKNTVTIPASALSQLASGQAVISGNSNLSNIIVLPAQYQV